MKDPSPDRPGYLNTWSLAGDSIVEGCGPLGSRDYLEGVVHGGLPAVQPSLNFLSTLCFLFSQDISEAQNTPATMKSLADSLPQHNRQHAMATRNQRCISKTWVHSPGCCQASKARS